MGWYGWDGLRCKSARGAPRHMGTANRPGAARRKTPARRRRYQEERRISWIWSSHWACSGFIRTERSVVRVGLSRRTVAGRFGKKEAGSSARARWRLLVAAEAKIRRDSAD